MIDSGMITIALLLLSFAAPSFAAPLPPMPAKAKTVSEAAENFKVTYKIKDGDLEDSGSFLILAGSQSNYVTGGEKAFESGNGPVKGIEYKKHGVIVNCLAVAKPATNVVRAEFQFEISGPSATPVGDLKARSISTFQFQTTFEVERGHSVVLVEGPSRRLEVKFETVAP